MLLLLKPHLPPSPSSFTNSEDGTMNRLWLPCLLKYLTDINESCFICWWWWTDINGTLGSVECKIPNVRLILSLMILGDGINLSWTEAMWNSTFAASPFHPFLLGKPLCVSSVLHTAPDWDLAAIAPLCYWMNCMGAYWGKSRASSAHFIDQSTTLRLISSCSLPQQLPWQWQNIMHLFSVEVFKIKRGLSLLSWTLSVIKFCAR